MEMGNDKSLSMQSLLHECGLSGSYMQRWNCKYSCKFGPRQNVQHEYHPTWFTGCQL